LQGRAQDNRIDEVAYNVIEFPAGTTTQGGPDADVVLARPLVKQHLIGSGQQHERRDTLASSKV
jgi:hypothetical protein